VGAVAVEQAQSWQNITVDFPSHEQFLMKEAAA